MTTTLASAVSTRVESLIDRHHHGNRSAAAYALGLDPEQLAGLLSGDWRRFSLDALAALVRGYDVSVGWLIAAPGRDAGAPAGPRRPGRPGERRAGRRARIEPTMLATSPDRAGAGRDG